MNCVGNARAETCPSRSESGGPLAVDEVYIVESLTTTHPSFAPQNPPSLTREGYMCPSPQERQGAAIADGRIHLPAGDFICLSRFHHTVISSDLSDFIGALRLHSALRICGPSRRRSLRFVPRSSLRAFIPRFAFRASHLRLCRTALRVTSSSIILHSAFCILHLRLCRTIPRFAFRIDIFSCHQFAQIFFFLLVIINEN